MVNCTRRQEFIRVGWNPSSTKAGPFASLLLAQREGDALVYRGNVGTGFDTETMAALAKKFASRERKTAPIEVGAVPADKVHWLKPEIVAEIALRSEEHTTELQSLMRISYAVLRLKKKKTQTQTSIILTI